MSAAVIGPAALEVRRLWQTDREWVAFDQDRMVPIVRRYAHTLKSLVKAKRLEARVVAAYIRPSLSRIQLRS